MLVLCDHTSKLQGAWGALPIKVCYAGNEFDINNISNIAGIADILRLVNCLVFRQRATVLVSVSV